MGGRGACENMNSVDNLSSLLFRIPISLLLPILDILVVSTRSEWGVR